MTPPAHIPYAPGLCRRSKRSLQSLSVHSRSDALKAGIPPPPASSPAFSSAHTASRQSNCLGTPFHLAAGRRSASLHATVSVGLFGSPTSTRLSLGCTPAELDSSPLPSRAVLPNSDFPCRHIPGQSGSSISSAGRSPANLPLQLHIDL